VAGTLSWLPKEYVTFNDILLPTGYRTSQIDHILVSPYGIFVIETKSYKGWIFGHENSEQWTQSLLGKRYRWGWSSAQHRFINPIQQNASHIRAVKTLLKDMGDVPIIAIVVFGDSAELKVTAPNHIVVNQCNLRHTIMEYRHPSISEADMQRIASRIAASNIISGQRRQKHVIDAKDAACKRESSISSGICPRCGGTLAERQGKYGTFIGCSNYPRCRFTYNP